MQQSQQLITSTVCLEIQVCCATDVVATHTYQNPINPTDWSSLKTAALEKPIWVTEAGNLHSPNWDMEDASYHINRILDGFNYGLTAYMLHLFYEKHDYQNEVNVGQNYGSSALVLWDSNMNIILPKRYYVFKHFTNLVKNGYQRIHTGSFDSGPKQLLLNPRRNKNYSAIVQIIMLIILKSKSPEDQ